MRSTTMVSKCTMGALAYSQVAALVRPFVFAEYKLVFFYWGYSGWTNECIRRFFLIFSLQWSESWYWICFLAYFCRSIRLPSLLRCLQTPLVRELCPACLGWEDFACQEGWAIIYLYGVKCCWYRVSSVMLASLMLSYGNNLCRFEDL